MEKQTFIEKVISVVKNSDYGIKDCLIPYLLRKFQHIPQSERKHDDEILEQEASAIFDFLTENDLLTTVNKTVKEVVVKANNINEILLIEAGAVDIEKLTANGFKVIEYKQGSAPPQFIKEFKGD